MKIACRSLAFVFFIGGVITTNAFTFEPYAWSTMAGNPASGHTDGQGSAARFNRPHGVALDGTGNIYVADTGNSLIRKITAGGLVTTIAGSGTGIGYFDRPQGVAVDGSGNIYVADTGFDVIRKILPDGTFITLAGSETASLPGSADGPGSAARFNLPFALAVDSVGNVYVADFGNHTVRKITPDGMVSTLAGMAGTTGSVDGPGSAARFDRPSAVAVDGAGNVYVTDYGNFTIRKITPIGVVSTLAGSPGALGSADGAGSNARFSNLGGITVDSAGSIYVGDWGNNTIRKITPGGDVTTLAGLAGTFGNADGAGSDARFARAGGVAVDSAGNVFVADANYSYSLPDSTSNTIRKVSPAGVVTTLAGSAGGFGNRDGVGSAARFHEPSGVAVTSAQDVFVADTRNHTIRKITPAGGVSTFAGIAGAGGSSDGPGSLARFASPAGIAADSAGTLYVADQNNHTIRKITPDGLVTTLAGLAGNRGSADGVGGAARFSSPQGVAVDSTGNVFVADSYNNTVRKITPDGTVSTLAGVAGSPGSVDGTGAVARFNFGRPGWSPSSYYYAGDVAVDGAGNVYVADTGNYTIRKITPAGVVTTLAGSAGQYGHLDATGAAARFTYPEGIAADKAGNIYVTGNGVVRKVTSAGIVTTLGTGGGHVDGIGSAARFSDPQGLAVDNAGNVHIADRNHTIRLGIPPGPSHLLNISTRLRVQPGDNALIGGFIITGSAPKRVVLRALGPSLTSSGIQEPLSDPVLELYDSAGVLLASNDNWKENQPVEIQQSGVPPTNDTEPAIVISLEPGPGYTAVVRGKSNAMGIALVEVYDLSPQADSVLANISTRGFVEAGNSVMIGGFILGGGSGGSSKVVVRALGPSLVHSGAKNTLPDPTLELRDGNGALVISNNDWRDTQQGEIEQIHLAPSEAVESALIANLPAGHYTTIVAGKDGGTGIALVEAYNLQ